MASSLFSIETELKMPRNFRKALLDAAAPVVERRLQQIAADAVDETEAIIRKTFVNDRSGRRRHSRTKHLAGSIRAEVVGDENGDGLPGLKIWSTAPAGKVGALELGIDHEYRIYPSAGGFLYFPSNLTARPKKGATPGTVSGRRQGAYTQFRARGVKQGGKGILLTKTNKGVKHPPYTGKHFMQQGLQKAIRKNT